MLAFSDGFFNCLHSLTVISGLPKEFLKTVNNKLKGLVLNIKEFLLTEKHIRRNFILSVSYVCLLLLYLESVNYSLIGANSLSMSYATKCYKCRCRAGLFLDKTQNRR